MNTHLYILLSFQIFLISFHIVANAYPENYTQPYLITARIGSHSTEIKLLLNSFSSNNILFANSNRKFSKEISTGRKSDAYMDKIEFNGNIISDFPFSLIMDNTGLNNQEIQGEFGLGIDKDNLNDLVEILFNNQIISKKNLILETSDDLLNNKISNIDTNISINEFKYCNLTRKSDLDNLYNEAWVCELSHTIIEEINSNKDSFNITWEKAKLVQARAVFDTRQKYLILPIKYLEKFEKIGNLEKCGKILDKSLSLQYFNCTKNIFEKIQKKNPFYFVIDGYGLKFTFDELFQEEGNFKTSIIRFTNTISNSNLFIFGVPLFKKYNIMFDYDNKRVGFKGENIVDFSKLYNNWKAEETVIKVNDSNILPVGWSHEKVIMAIGAIVGGIIILYALFFIIRVSKRDDSTKIHSTFVEQVKEY